MLPKNEPREPFFVWGLVLVVRRYNASNFDAASESFIAEFPFSTLSWPRSTPCCVNMVLALCVQPTTVRSTLLLQAFFLVRHLLAPSLLS